MEKQIKYENYLIVLSYGDDDAFATFKVYKATLFGDGDCDWEYHKIGQPQAITTTNVSLATEYMSGIVKWDGCADYTLNDTVHICGRLLLNNFVEMLQIIHSECGKIISNSDDEEFGLTNH